MSDTIDTLLVAIPCFNEGATIAAVLRRIPGKIDGVSKIIKIVVDDGSTDNTASVACANGAHVLSHSFNRGLGHAFQTAVEYCVTNRVSCLVTIDGDGQFAPEDISRLLAPIINGSADFVTASRFIDPDFHPENISAVKWWGNKRMSSLISKLTRRKFYDVSCGFRAYSEKALLNLNLHGQFTYTQEVFLDLSFKGLRIQEVPVQVVYHSGRKSRMASSTIRYAFKSAAIILRCYRDYRPLLFFWSISVVLGFVSLLLGAIFMGHFALTGKFSDYLWAGFSFAFFFLLSLTFFILGLSVDMLGRIRSNQERMLVYLKKQSRTKETNGF